MQPCTCKFSACRRPRNRKYSSHKDDATGCIFEILIYNLEETARYLDCHKEIDPNFIMKAGTSELEQRERERGGEREIKEEGKKSRGFLRASSKMHESIKPPDVECLSWISL